MDSALRASLRLSNIAPGDVVATAPPRLHSTLSGIAADQRDEARDREPLMLCRMISPDSR